MLSEKKNVPGEIEVGVTGRIQVFEVSSLGGRGFADHGVLGLFN